MSFRTEDKFYLNTKDKFKISKFLLDNEAKKIYPDRTVLSLYFDTHQFDMFSDSEEGIVPRKKIRIRQYNKNIFDLNESNSSLEIKINSVEGKFKISKKILSFRDILKKGYFDKDYGLCFPCIYVSYKRSYFLHDKSRITIDSDIRYKEFKSISKTFSSFDRQVILEIKSNNRDHNNMLNDIPLNKVRYSKFCEAIKCTKLFY